MGRVAIATRRRERRLRRRAVDNAALRLHHRQFREGLWRYVLGGSVLTALSAPVIYSLLIPFVLLDAWVMFYQAICFRAWGIRRVRRRDYFAIDRHRLSYLNALEKLNCLYCSYANGVIALTREVAGRTEQYWCPIRHARRLRQPHEHYAEFATYGDAAAYRTRLSLHRQRLRR